MRRLPSRSLAQAPALSHLRLAWIGLPFRHGVADFLVEFQQTVLRRAHRHDAGKAFGTAGQFMRLVLPPRGIILKDDLTASHHQHCNTVRRPGILRGLAVLPGFRLGKLLRALVLALQQGQRCEKEAGEQAKRMFHAYFFFGFFLGTGSSMFFTVMRSTSI